MDLKNLERLNKSKALFMELNKLLGWTVPFDRQMLLISKKWMPDIIALDQVMKSRIPEYDGEKCTYQGKPNYSMAMVIRERYGQRAEDIINELNTL